MKNHKKSNSYLNSSALDIQNNDLDFERARDLNNTLSEMNNVDGK